MADERKQAGVGGNMEHGIQVDLKGAAPILLTSFLQFLTFLFIYVPSNFAFSTISAALSAAQDESRALRPLCSLHFVFSFLLFMSPLPFQSALTSVTVRTDTQAAEARTF